MRRAYALFLLVSLTAGGCDSDPEIAVQAMLPGTGSASAVPTADVPVRLLPYDRDSIIADLRKNPSKPEPQVPPELLAQIDSLQRRIAQTRPGDTTIVARQRTLSTLRAKADSIEAARREWSAATLAGFSEAVQAKLDKLDGLQELADTTDATGTVTFRAPEGRWWVFARYLLPDRELYWNLPIHVRGEATTVRLTPENATSRPAP